MPIRPLLPLFAALFLTGCDSCIFGVISCDNYVEPVWDTGWDTGDVGSTDTGETDTDAGTGTMEIVYALTWGSEVRTCDEADVSSLVVTLSPTTGSDLVVWSPCTDDPVQLLDLAADTYELTVHGDTSYGAFYASEPVYVQVVDGGATSIAIELLCEENGVYDGCGGA